MQGGRIQQLKLLLVPLPTIASATERVILKNNFTPMEIELSLTVIGAGVGRTGTYSLKLALEKLGFGRCFHMEEVAKNLPEQLPLWNAALEGYADWDAIYRGYGSAVDWPTARFFRELRSDSAACGLKDRCAAAVRSLAAIPGPCSRLRCATAQEGV